MRNSLHGVWILLAVISCGCEVEPMEGKRQQDTTHGATRDSRSTSIFAGDLPFDQVEPKLRDSDPQHVADAIVQMVTMQHRPEVVSLLEDAWGLATDRRPYLNWIALQDDRVRVALAQVLGQWHPDDPQYREYILAAIDRSQGLSRTNAIIALGAVSTDADISYLERVAREEVDDIVAAGALAALQIAGKREAIQALENIAGDSKLSVQRRELASQILGLPRPPPRDE